ncbi:hypothetical protein PC9H_003134 [Pleurotus ostreatus]|uniref:Uncharacterized protein n=1 Tax=Pleurotus ostreatus TaxID=5322 RepID=A0A8H7A596_PLEOS|nr:uncharacterized protein PC9H_003134 [Pleurotus ostreatus]KAF7436305.1 hypothetical protein PC9H_003134 [Pleurotus ostreatus]
MTDPAPATMASHTAYIIISPDPRYWAALDPTVVVLPSPPHSVVNAVGTNFYVKIGDQGADGKGAVSAYKRTNPSFFWIDLVIKDHTGHKFAAGKTLENMILGKVVQGEGMFKHIGHSNEWFYCFNNATNLLNFINNVCLPNDDGFLTYDDVKDAYSSIEGYFRTA